MRATDVMRLTSLARRRHLKLHCIEQIRRSGEEAKRKEEAHHGRPRDDAIVSTRTFSISWLVDPAALRRTPSMTRHGIPWEQELLRRQELIRDMSEILCLWYRKIQMAPLCYAATYLHRYFMLRSVHTSQSLALMGALMSLAIKNSDTDEREPAGTIKQEHQRLPDTITERLTVTLHHWELRQKGTFRPEKVQRDPVTNRELPLLPIEYEKLLTIVKAMEQELMTTFAYDFDVHPPNDLVAAGLSLLGNLVVPYENQELDLRARVTMLELAQRCKTICLDFLYTAACVLHDPDTIACAVIVAALATTRIQLPQLLDKLTADWIDSRGEHKTWWRIFPTVNRTTVIDAVSLLYKNYCSSTLPMQKKIALALRKVDSLMPKTIGIRPLGTQLCAVSEASTPAAATDTPYGHARTPASTAFTPYNPASSSRTPHSAGTPGASNQEMSTRAGEGPKNASSTPVPPPLVSPPRSPHPLSQEHRPAKREREDDHSSGGRPPQAPRLSAQRTALGDEGRSSLQQSAGGEELTRPGEERAAALLSQKRQLDSTQDGSSLRVVSSSTGR
ncbi:hypothetical protein E5Q_04417 [Mixia osmundae IAM 14324]|uniref:Uncharacterized protein n=1 Tax=Mixia osmundae (strain CBS 9802 / IAM 14324 / JCM 22182 / KY 12970) TaxID=764103 RepID=G7E4H8_MIXOS|nr:hypothetical protein E5Q_04417 [Mixia osmundae IAM 14324]